MGTEEETLPEETLPEETLPEETLPPALAPDVGPPERIEVEGLVLRRWTSDDLQARFEAISASYEHLHAWMDWIPEPPTLEGQRAWDELRGVGWLGEDSFNYGIFDAADGTVLGAIGAHDRLGPGALEIGYWCHVAHTGKGVITRAARALTRILLELDGIERVEIHCDEANTRSAAVPRRLGYRLDRIEDDGIHAPNESGRGMVWIKERERSA
ncbi:GNAT family N-acetyltransferase [Actinocrinis sp.]|uniref:GNAT family N-acetyltransferase n=1 Tax=Actinocrinis sp. TaxID=1920516 RepID=UPI002D2D5417|nr:GNAT family N-acetyltransferase [Actinocrinis sp.]HZP52153.1 GNAT family N-acetyltransferase [Actinocrinis sp.]